jgi:hypothetical protein
VQGRALGIFAAALLAAFGGAAVPGSPLEAEDAAALQQDSTGADHPTGRWLTARVVAPLRLRARPGGRALARLRPRTGFGSPRVLGVVRRRPGWLQVVATERPNGRQGWIPARAVRVRWIETSLHVDRSRRTVAVRRGGRVVRRFRVAVGGRRTPTPAGRFAVTDRLRMRPARRAAYGCCAIALSGHQRRLLPGWSGGDRLAIHGTRQPWTIGRAASLGCLRANSRDVRALMRTLPLGAPVFITP